MGVEVDLPLREVGGVKRVEALRVVLLRVALRQEEWLRESAAVVDLGQVEARVEPVVAAAGEDDPARVRRPVVIAVGLVAVHLRQLAGLARAEVEQPLLALVVPDGEVAVVGEGEQEPSAVVAGAGPGEALAHLDGVEHGVDRRAEAGSLGVEGDAAEVVLLVLEMRRILLLAAGHVVERAAVGGEHGGVLAPVLRLEQRVGDDLVGRGIIDEHVALEVEHLDALVAHDVESLARLIRREGAILAARVPVGIDHRAAQLVIAGLEPLAAAVRLYHRGPVVAAHVEHEPRGVGPVGRVAVDAHAGHLRVLQDGRLVERGEVALVESHVTIHLVARCDAAIGESPGVHGMGADVDLEVAVLLPPVALAGADGECQLATLVAGRQRVPVVDVEVGKVALGMQFAALRAAHHHVDHLGAVSDIEVQRRDFRRDGHARVVGVDLRQPVSLCRVHRARCAGGEQLAEDGEEHILQSPGAESSPDSLECHHVSYFPIVR